MLFCISLNWILLSELPASLEALKNEKLSIHVTYTRKSLVKGERFIRELSKWLECCSLRCSKIHFQTFQLKIFVILAPFWLKNCYSSPYTYTTHLKMSKFHANSHSYTKYTWFQLFTIVQNALSKQLGWTQRPLWM